MDNELLDAAKFGDLTRVNALLAKGANVNASSYNGTALHLAARNGHTNVVKLLVKKGADVNASSYDGTALHSAAKNGHKEIVKLLVEKGADVNAVNQYGDTALHLAARKGHTDAVNALLDNKADVNAVDNYGSTALHLAVREGHTDAVNALLTNNADVNAVRKYAQKTALHYAVENNHIDIVSALLANGADPFLLSQEFITKHIKIKEVRILILNTMISAINRILVLPNDINNYPPILEEITQQDIDNNTSPYSTMLSLCNTDGIKAIKLSLLKNAQDFLARRHCYDLPNDHLVSSSTNTPDSLYKKSLQALFIPCHSNLSQEALLAYLNDCINNPDKSSQFYDSFIDLEQTKNNDPHLKRLPQGPLTDSQITSVSLEKKSYSTIS